MKKVRMVAGLAFPATAALATVAGTGTANAATTTGAQTTAVTPAITCPTTVVFSSTSIGNAWTGYVWGLNNCAGFQEAILWRSQTGVTERVRYRNAANTLLFTNRLGGTISAGATFFWSNHNLDAFICWQAAVKNGTSTIINNDNALVGTLVP